MRLSMSDTLSAGQFTGSGWQYESRNGRGQDRSTRVGCQILGRGILTDWIDSGRQVCHIMEKGCLRRPRLSDNDKDREEQAESAAAGRDCGPGGASGYSGQGQLRLRQQPRQGPMSRVAIQLHKYGIVADCRSEKSSVASKVPGRAGP